MLPKPYKDRAATAKDVPNLKSMTTAAFPTEEGDLIAKLVTALVVTPSQPETLISVVEHTGEIVAAVIFSPVYLESAPRHNGYILAPLAVHPKHQKCGLGKHLVTSGLNSLKAAKVDTVLVYGDPKYYGRFGFETTYADPFIPPFPLAYPFGWQAIQLSETPHLKSSHVVRCVDALNQADYW